MYAPVGPYQLIMFISALVALVSSSVAWRRRTAPGAGFLALTELLVAVWAIGAALESMALTLELKLAWAAIVHVGGSLSPVMFLGFALALSGTNRLLTPVSVVLACLVPITTIGLAMTNAQHHLMWSAVTMLGPGRSAIFHPGPWFWVFIAYTYVNVTIGAVLFWRKIVRSRSYAPWQVILFIVATLAPVVTSVVYLMGIGPTVGMDLTPAGFMITGVSLIIGVRYLMLFDLVPVARHEVLDTMADAVLVLDAQQRVVDLNAAMGTLFQDARSHGPRVIGEPVLELLTVQGGLTSALAQAQETSVDLLWQIGDQARDFDVRTTPLHDPQGALSGWLLVLRDVTERKALQAERERLIGELEETIGQVKTLSGLLPICASCKRIRDEQNQWHSVEMYVAEHSEANFTHGICPECMQAYLAELDEMVPPQGE